MIKFFRKIRQNLLTENKISKYLIYAIGEIILVVIGILIALGINNWNQKNQTKREEIKILTELKTALENDLKFMTINLRGHKFQIRELNVIKEQLTLENPTNDSLNYFFKSLLFTNSVDITTAPFETLNSKGLDLISDDELRNAIIFYYGQSVKYYIDKDFFLDRNFTIEYCTQLFNTVAWKSNTRRNQIIPNDLNSLKKDKVFLNLINTKIGETEYQNENLKYVIKENRALLKTINSVLTKLE